MSKFAVASSYELLIVITIIVSAVAGYHAPEIGNWIFTIMDFG